MRVFSQQEEVAKAARVQTRMHWSGPDVDAAERRVLRKSRRQMAWAVMHVAERLEILPPEMWMLIFTFVKHEHPPAYRGELFAPLEAVGFGGDERRGQGINGHLANI